MSDRLAAAAVAAFLLGFAACSHLPRSRSGGVETGVASWYGREFHGRPTSSREVYDMNDMTAAHKTLAFGTYVMVTNLDNDRSAVVRINDRGPFVRGRTIDLSYAAARVLGVVGPGTARVRLEILRRFKAREPSKSSAVWVQVGAFTVQENAAAIKKRLDGRFRGVVVARFKTDRGAYFRVRVRTSEGEAPGLARRLAGEGYPVIIVRE